MTAVALCQPSARAALARILGASAATQRLRARVARVAPTDIAVLLEGETGTGKELVARVLHAASRRAGGPFVPVNCAALAPEIAEAELFGHERGAFTGAVARRRGRVAEAEGGTLFLDEIGDLPGPMQAKLLRLLQEGEVQRLGVDRPVRADVRVVAATNRSLRPLVAAGGFRADCLYRLAGCTIALPPLRERAGDVVLLAEVLLVRAAAALGAPAPRLTGDAAAALARHAWPGNVRELENVVRECVLFADGGPIDGAAVRAALGPAVPDDAPPSLEEALRLHGGNVTRAARALGVSRPTVYARMRARGIAPRRLASAAVTGGR